MSMATKFDLEPGYGWRAVVPACSANLGSAFDCGALALQLYLNASFTPGSKTGLSLEYHGQTPERFPLDDSNLILHALRYAAAKLDAAPPCGHVAVSSEIPVGVGLGSSAAAVIAGLLLGARYAGAEVEAAELLRWANEIEGHVDDAAGSYHGGLVFSLSNNMDRVVTVRADFPQSIGLVIVSPERTVPTREARKVLPQAYERADIVHTLQRAAVLVATCFSGNFDLFPELFDDKLHQPYRQQFVPGIERCLGLRMDGLLGVAISGSGSSVIAFAARNHEAIAEALKEIFTVEGIAAEVRFTSADNCGAWVTREPVRASKTLEQEPSSLRSK
jgi:homoserine kinase